MLQAWTGNTFVAAGLGSSSKFSGTQESGVFSVQNHVFSMVLNQVIKKILRPYTGLHSPVHSLVLLSTGCLYSSSLPTSMETSKWIFTARLATGPSSGGGGAARIGHLGSLSTGELTSSSEMKGG